MRNLLSLACFFLAGFSAQSFAQRSFPGNPPYNTVSSNPKEVIIAIHPVYKIRTVTDEKTGEEYEQITFSGGSLKGFAIGAPAEEWIPVGLLAPSKELAKFEVIGEEDEPVQSGMLAPVAKWTFTRDGFKTPVEHFIRNTNLYSSAAGNIVSIGSANIYRTAYTQELRINPIRYDAAMHSIRLIKNMTVKITFYDVPPANTAYLTTLRPEEAELFENLFANGNISGFYHSAVGVVTKALSPASVSSKTSASPASLTGENWLLISTNDQGVYHITSADLANAGISNASPSTLQLFGYGGQAIPEDLDSATGEMHECALDILTNSDGSFAEARFYEPGTTEWHFIPESGSTPLFGLFHLLNPFTTSGHYLLKAGGSSSSKRIVLLPDNVISPLPQNTVPAVAVHEDEERFENPDISREFVGEDIPNGRDVTVNLPDLPGYTSDSTVLRPGFDSHAQNAHTFNLSLNGTQLNPIIDGSSLIFGYDQYSARNWGTEILASNLLRAQNNTLTLSATTSEGDANFALDWVEVFYRRQASLGGGQVPFYLLSDGRALMYNFTEAANGQTWDVTDPSNPVKMALANGSSMSVPIQGDPNGFRQFIAFTPASLKTPSVSSAGTLALRNGICQTGAADIIVTPAAYINQANKLAKQRIMGGQATGPLTVAVVTVEDIYKEFGYGSNDYTAIRNFLSYTFRHTTANNTIKPLYLTLFANGHCDYRNKTTQLPVDVPIYEIWRTYSASELRSGEPPYSPDDAFFVRLTPGSDMLDVAVGRVTVHNADEADAFVSKVIKYETSSDQGDWRSRATFVCDDRHYDDDEGNHGVFDPLQHIFDTGNEMKYVPGRILFHDIFGQSYPRISTATDIRMPEMEKAIVDAFNSGSVILSWVGHGNPAVWAHEAVLTVPATINKITNINRLAFVTTATCDFSACDDYSKPVAGGVLLITKPDGGAIGSLGTSRSVSPEETAPSFYAALFSIGCNEGVGTSPIGVAYIAARKAGSPIYSLYYYILGDPAQRLIFPRQFVAIDSINGIPSNELNAPITIPALTQLTISGHISNVCDGSDLDANFNGSTTVTLFDAPTHVSATSTFPNNTPAPITDHWDIDGPILYRGNSTVTGGRFRATFIVSKDIKFDTSRAKISMLAYSDNFHSALGVDTNIIINGIDTARADSDHQGPSLVPYIGSRAFKSGDVVPVNSMIIVDVSDISGLNTSTASIGHSFIAWTDDSTAGAIDLASTYVSKQDDYTTGTSTQQAKLPVGKHVLQVRAFDALDNPTYAQVEFTARDVQPYELYNTTITPNPVHDVNSFFTFLQPSSPESPVDVTISIYTIIGQKVRDLSAQSISQNSVSIPFDGNDNFGTPLPDGAYIYRVTARERLTTNQTNEGGKFIIRRQ